jgi:hypothetical protein
MCNNCENKSESGGSFIFGIVLGAIIGAVVAIYIYKNNRADIFDNLQKFQNILPSLQIHSQVLQPRIQPELSRQNLNLIKKLPLPFPKQSNP